MGINDRIKDLWYRLKPDPADGNPVQGADVLAALKNAVHDGRKIFKGGTFVTDHYEVHLADADHRFLQPILEPLKKELLEELSRYILKKGYQTPSGEVTLQIRSVRTLEAGTVKVVGSFRGRASLDGGPCFMLVIHSDKGREMRFELCAGAHILGRGQNADLRVAGDPTVSSQHCEFLLEGDRLRVKDLGSANGTMVNGRRIESECELEAGDRLLTGHTEIEVVG